MVGGTHPAPSAHQRAFGGLQPRGRAQRLGAAHEPLLGPQLEKSPVVDIQISPTSPRKVFFAFQSGAVAVYEGN